MLFKKNITIHERKFMTLNNNNNWDLYEEIKSRLFTHQKGNLLAAVYAHKDFEMTVDQVTSFVSNLRSCEEALACLIELESRWQEYKKIPCRVPKVIDIGKDAWKLDDGLWYQSDMSYNEICPKCGRAGEYTYFSKQGGLVLCKTCKVSWKPEYPSSPARLPQDCNADLLSEASSYTPASEIYGKSLYADQLPYKEYFPYIFNKVAHRQEAFEMLGMPKPQDL
jgi:hypothetical protein